MSVRAALNVYSPSRHPTHPPTNPSPIRRLYLRSISAPLEPATYPSTHPPTPTHPSTHPSSISLLASRSMSTTRGLHAHLEKSPEGSLVKVCSRWHMGGCRGRRGRNAHM